MKAKIFTLSSIFMFLSFGFVSCSSENENTITPEISVPNGYVNYFIEDLSFGYKADEAKIAFQINANWSMNFVSTSKDLSEWCTITPSSGEGGLHKVFVNVTQNDTYEPRSGNIYLMVGSQKVAEIVVEQSYENAIILNCSSDTISYEATTIEIDVNSNVDIQYTILDDATSWVSEFVNSRAMNTHNFVFEIAENKSFNLREARILFYNTEFSLADTLVLIQTGNPDGFVDGTPILYGADNIIAANGIDKLSFIVKVGDMDVTSKAAFYLNDQPYNSNTFSTEISEVYDFYSVYNEQRTNAISVRAIDSQLYASLPEDSNSEQFESFVRKVLVVQATGTWCGYCPYMIEALELFKKNGSNADKAVIAATHSGDKFSNIASEATISEMGIRNFPSCVFNLNPEVVVENNYPGISAENINATIGEELKGKAHIGIAASSSTTPDKISVYAAVKIGNYGAYRINAWLIEDGVAASQSSNWYEFSNGMASVIIDHKHILRDASCVNPILGEWLGGKERCDVGETIEFYHEFDIKKANISNIENCKIAILVSTIQDNSHRFTVNNIIEFKVGEAKPFVYY